MLLADIGGAHYLFGLHKVLRNRERFLHSLNAGMIVDSMDSNQERSVCGSPGMCESVLSGSERGGASAGKSTS
jgi:hypothetical protein